MAPDHDPVIEVAGLSKRFCRSLGGARSRLLRQYGQALLGRSDNDSLREGEFWALQKVSLTIRRGEAVGLLGLNGAGKSTLLSIIAGYLLPDAGAVRTRGKISALINLTTGFEASLSGRENIFLKGAFAGRSRDALQRVYADIVEFAELGEFIEAPVSTYSSGMRMRLAFAIAIHVEPDIILIDEVLAVGDFRFRQKCLRRLNEIRDRCAFVLVSHAFEQIARFCDRVILLEKGLITYDGQTREGLQAYSRNSSAPTGSALTGEQMLDKQSIADVQIRWQDAGGHPVDQIELWGDAYLWISFTLLRTVRQLVIGIPFYTETGDVVGSINSELKPLPVTVAPGQRLTMRARLPRIGFNPGIYTAVLAVVDGTVYLCRKPAGAIEITSSMPLKWGTVTPSFEWMDVEIHEVEH